MSRLQRPQGFILVSMIMLLACLFTLLFAMLTLSEQRSRLVHLNTERTILGAEARAGLSEAAHLLAGISDWSDAARPNSHYLETQRREEPLPLPLVAVPVDLAAASSRGDVHSGVPVELTPGRYGDLTTGAKGHVVLQPGDYLFDRIEMGQNSVLLQSEGKVRIFVRERVEFGSNTRINMDAENQDSTSLLILADYSTGQKTEFHFDSNCDLVGALYNPLGPIHLESNTQVFGNVTGDTIQMDSFAQVHKDRALQSVVLAPDPDGGQGVRRTSWSSW